MGEQPTFSAQLMRDNLLPALTDAARAVSRRNTLPVLANLHLAGDGDIGLTVTGTDLEMAISASVPGHNASGAITVNAKNLIAAVKVIPRSELVTLTGNADGTRLAVNGTTLEAIPATEYPKLPVAPEPLTRIFGTDLARIIATAGIAAADDEARPILTAISLELDRRLVRAVGADNYRLSIDEAELIDTVEPVTVNVPAANLATLAAILPVKHREAIDFSFTASKAQVAFSWPGRVVVSRIIDGQFPNYRQIIPVDGWEATAKVDRAGLVTATKAAQVVAKQGNNVVRYHVNTGIDVSAKLYDGSAGYAGNVPAETTGEAHVSLNAGFIADLVKLPVGDELFWQLRGPLMPSVLSAGSWMYVVMPVRTAA